MQFFEHVKRLAIAFFKFERLKNMHPVLAVLCAILASPFMVAFLSYIAILFFQSILLSIFRTPIECLHSIMKKEGNEVKTATQVVIYFFSWPLLFFLYFLFYLTTFLFYLTYFFAATFGFIASFCGYKYHVSPLEEDISIKLPLDEYLIRPIVYVAVVFILFLILGIAAIATYNALYTNYQEEYFLVNFLPTMMVIGSLYTLFSFIYIPVAFNREN